MHRTCWLVECQRCEHGKRIGSSYRRSGAGAGAGRGRVIVVGPKPAHLARQVYKKL